MSAGMSAVGTDGSVLRCAAVPVVAGAAAAFVPACRAAGMDPLAALRHE
jgi:hypothetical protein